MVDGSKIGVAYRSQSISVSLDFLPPLERQCHATGETRMTDEISAKIQALPRLQKSELVILWRELFATPPHPKLRRELMVPILAYRMAVAVEEANRINQYQSADILAFSMPSRSSVYRP